MQRAHIIGKLRYSGEIYSPSINCGHVEKEMPEFRGQAGVSWTVACVMVGANVIDRRSAEPCADEQRRASNATASYSRIISETLHVRRYHPVRGCPVYSSIQTISPWVHQSTSILSRGLSRQGYSETMSMEISSTSSSSNDPSFHDKND